MTREEALALARIVSEVDGVALLDPIRVKQRARPTRTAERWYASVSSIGLRWGVLGELADPLLGLTRALEDALRARYLATAREFTAR